MHGFALNVNANLGYFDLMIPCGIRGKAYEWIKNAQAGVETTSGTVMLASLPILLGFNLLVGAVNYDITSIPRTVTHKIL